MNILLHFILLVSQLTHLSEEKESHPIIPALVKGIKILSQEKDNP